MTIRRTACFISGLLIAGLALAGSAHGLAGDYPFCIHMVKHMLLLLIAPALLVTGLPPWPLAAPGRVLRAPLVAWTCGMAAMAFWHLPPVFNAAMTREPLQVAEELSLIAAGLIFWWPVLGPNERNRMQPVPQAFVYLVSACAVCTLTGVLITFAPPALYRMQTSRLDRQAGGTIMWTGGCAIYVAAAMVQFARWYEQDNKPQAGETAWIARS